MTEINGEVSRPEATQYDFLSVLEWIAKNSSHLKLHKIMLASIQQFVSLSMTEGKCLTFKEYRDYSLEGSQNFYDFYIFVLEEQGVHILQPFGEDVEKGMVVDYGVLDLEALKRALYKIKKENTMISQRIEESMEASEYFYPHAPHVGEVELSPVRSGEHGLIGIMVKDSEGYIWSVKDMKKLANEILAIANNDDNQEIIDYRNAELRKRKLKEQELAVQKREETVKKKYVPQPGCVILFQAFPSGKYKFTHSSALTVQQKINRIKEEYGENTNIVHAIEVANTRDFFYKFCKKQYENRILSDYWYDLNDEDIEYFTNEVYPPQAMEWMNGK